MGPAGLEPVPHRYGNKPRGASPSRGRYRFLGASWGRAVGPKGSSRDLSGRETLHFADGDDPTRHAAKHGKEGVSGSSPELGLALWSGFWRFCGPSDPPRPGLWKRYRSLRDDGRRAWRPDHARATTPSPRRPDREGRAARLTDLRHRIGLNSLF